MDKFFHVYYCINYYISLGYEAGELCITNVLLLCYLTSKCIVYPNLNLQLYNFGETVSIVLWTDSWKPDSFYDKIASNRKQGLHTLCLLGKT